MPPQKRAAGSIQEPAQKIKACAPNPAAADYDFQFKLKKDPEYSGDLMVVTGKAKFKGSPAGTLEGRLVCRPSRSDFMVVCDERQQLTGMAQAFCNSTGAVRRDIEGLQHASAQAQASFGGFLVIEMVQLLEVHRGNAVGISFVEALLKWLVGKWSLCVLQSAPVIDRHEDPPGLLEMHIRSGAQVPTHIIAERRAVEETNRKKRQEASQKIANQWSRLGFRQRQRGSDLFYLVPESLTKEGDTVDQPSLLSDNVVRQPLSEVDAELVSLVTSSQAGIDPAVLKITPLFESAAKELIAKGACIDRSNALHHAVANDKVVALVTLSQCLGGDVNHKDPDGNTPLHVACSLPTCPIETILMLLQVGASITDIDQEGRRPAKMLADNIHHVLGFRAAFHLTARPMDRDQTKGELLWQLLTDQESSALRGCGLTEHSPLPDVIPQVEKLLFNSSLVAQGL